MHHKKKKYIRYLDLKKDIFLLNEIFGDLHWRNKLLVFTWHFKEEFEKIGKPLEFVINILDHGKHVLVSKKQNKFNVCYNHNKTLLCLSYVEQEDIILIHIKPKRKK